MAKTAGAGESSPAPATVTVKQEHIDSDFDDFLKKEGLLAECEARALKRVVTWQIRQEMKRRRISRAKLASVKTNRATLAQDDGHIPPVRQLRLALTSQQVQLRLLVGVRC